MKPFLQRSLPREPPGGFLRTGWLWRKIYRNGTEKAVPGTSGFWSASCNSRVSLTDLQRKSGGWTPSSGAPSGKPGRAWANATGNSANSGTCSQKNIRSRRRTPFRKEEPEEAQEEPSEEAEESPAQEEDPKSARKKRRRSRYPPRYSSPQQELRDAAAHAGMRIHPDQPITPDDIQHYRRQLEEQHRREAEAASAARARQQEIFQRYKDRMEQSAQFERPNYHHIDMSPEGFYRSGTPREPETDPHLSESLSSASPPPEQRKQPESVQPDVPQRERPIQAQKAVALAEKQEDERQRTQYVLKSVTQTVGGVSYVMESAARRQLSSIPYKTGNDALIGLAKGTYYVSTAAGVGSALLRSNPAASLDRASRTVTSAQLAAHSNDAIRRRRELKSQIQVTQQALSQLSGKPPDKRTASKQAQLRADLSAMRQEKLRLDRQIPRNQQVNRFRHERTLDREIMKSLRPDGKKVPSSPKRVNQLSQQMLKEKRSSLEKKYAAWRKSTVPCLGRLHSSSIWKSSI